MNQLRAHIRPGVLMIEQYVESASQFGRFVSLLLESRGARRIGNCTCRKVHAEEGLLIQVIPADGVTENHRVQTVRDDRGDAINHGGPSWGKVPTRHNARQIGDVSLSVTWYSIALRIKNRSAVLIQRVHANRE